MTEPLPPVLVVDDEKNMRRSLQTMLMDEGYAVRAGRSPPRKRSSCLRRNHSSWWITDARPGGMSGYNLLGKIRSQWPDLPALMITAYATPKLAVEAIKAGAMDYLLQALRARGTFPGRLAVRRAAPAFARECRVKIESRRTDRPGIKSWSDSTAKMRDLRQLIQTVAVTDARVLVLGESGTGKELVAGAIHSLSHRRNRSYVRINCAAIPETLLESELFGHEKGAFTGAIRLKSGQPRGRSHVIGGTIFLDEIADMGKPLQAKLLRFLEDGTFTRVGGTEELRVNVRLIAATNRDIVKTIAAG